MNNKTQRSNYTRAADFLLLRLFISAEKAKLIDEALVMSPSIMYGAGQIRS
ncbi:MAG TPA: hypothetical protein VHQ93_03075 [Chitinophagaceae bacterium]|nr:hypothetical protein [Chitinophagaceae bacterium]